MATPLTIEDPEAHRLASEIARQTGKSLTRVVVDALRRERAALRPAPGEIDMAKVRAILARFDGDPGPARMFPASWTSSTMSQACRGHAVPDREALLFRSLMVDPPWGGGLEETAVQGHCSAGTPSGDVGKPSWFPPAGKNSQKSSATAVIGR